MNLGTAMAGGNPADGREEDEFYPTPPECTRALLAVESFTGSIWEPFSGDDAIVKILRGAGYKVVATDINPRGTGGKADFLKIRPRKVPNIVSNPPFNIGEEVIEHALRFDPEKLVFMLKATYWHALGRNSLFKTHKPAIIYPLTWRPDFMGKGRPTMEVMWCVWDRNSLGPDTIYRPLLKAECDRAKPRANRSKAAITITVNND